MSTNVEHEWETIEDYHEYLASEWGYTLDWGPPQGENFERWLQDNIQACWDDGIHEAWEALQLASYLGDLEHLRYTHRV
jgi:hypothetical protein